ncbi:hypothetical protein DRW03_24850 [Corallococcus sp. H22C18031201]|nr:hypothetical protein DRW03_24850 [Corallococcus sp. H22C18031201]
MPLALLPRRGVGEREGFVQVEPTLVVDGGAEFGLNLGAPVRLRLGGGDARGGWVRKEDWDTLSDWGQWVRALKLGSDAAPMGVWLGALESYSLLSQHLVQRYSNRGNPNYHPAGGFLTGALAPFYVEAFASDVLGARLIGAEVELDVQHVLFGRPSQAGRFTLALSAVHDWGRAGGDSPELTLAHLDGTAVVVVHPDYEMHLLAGYGGRPGRGGAWGAVAGVGMDVETLSLNARLRLELRRQHGGFRQGTFGPDYELARFRVAGVTAGGGPAAEAPFPDGYSVYAEANVGWDRVRLGGLLQRHLDGSLAVEAFSWGRVDMDGRVAVQLFTRSLELALSGRVVGANVTGTRSLVSAEMRWRFAGKLYALARGGTLLFPSPGWELRPGSFVSMGLGVDNAR